MEESINANNVGYEFMNDFTKEELQHIYDGLWMLGKLGWEKTDLTYCKKIGAMIDNHCEHESDGYVYYKSGVKCTDFLIYVSSDSPCLLKCKKCSQLFDDGRP